MTKFRKFLRGYNQTEVLANEVSSLINLPVESLLEKRKQKIRQAKQGRAGRLKLTESAFRLKKGVTVKDKTILLIDDVTTTGATAQIVSSLLKRKGAKVVYLLTVASVSNIDKA